MVVGGLAFCGPGTFNALNGLGGAGTDDPIVGALANSCLYGTFAISGAPAHICVLACVCACVDACLYRMGLLQIAMSGVASVIVALLTCVCESCVWCYDTV